MHEMIYLYKLKYLFHFQLLIIYSQLPLNLIYLLLFRFWLLRYLSFFLLFPTCFVSNTFLKTFFVFLHKK
ncbi:hypothetical protein F2X85_06085 [Staphylococcus aureus]|nr:hypothetical protein F2X85_06085 [Staphylococcus aureus]